MRHGEYVFQTMCAHSVATRMGVDYKYIPRYQFDAQYRGVLEIAQYTVVTAQKAYGGGVVALEEIKHIITACIRGGEQLSLG